MKAAGWSAVALAAVVAIVGVTAALHREVPLTPQMVPAALLRQAAWKHQPSRAWRELSYEADKTLVPAGEAPIEATVRHRIENLGNGLVRSYDDWYPRGAAQTLIHEERYLNVGNVFSLLVRYRETAPAFHAIFESEGWFENRVVALALEEGPGAPGSAGWFLRGSVERQEGIAPTPEASQPKQLKRSFDCRPLPQGAAKPPARPMVVCEIEDSDRGKHQRKLVYLQEAAVFVPIEVDQRLAEGSIAQGRPRKLKLDGEELAL